MTPSPFTTLAAAGAVASTVAAGPLMQVFDQMGLVMAIMGALGGASWSLANRLRWRDVLRSIALGGLLAFGLGALSPPLLSTFLGVEFSPQGSLVQTLASASFAVGFLQEMIFSRFTRGKADE